MGHLTAMGCFTLCLINGLLQESWVLNLYNIKHDRAYPLL